MQDSPAGLTKTSELAPLSVGGLALANASSVFSHSRCWSRISKLNRHQCGFLALSFSPCHGDKVDPSPSVVPSSSCISPTKRFIIKGYFGSPCPPHVERWDMRPLKNTIRLSLVIVDIIQYYYYYYLRFNDKIAAFGAIPEPLFYQVGNYGWGGRPLSVAHKEEHMEYCCGLPEVHTFLIAKQK